MHSDREAFDGRSQWAATGATAAPGRHLNRDVRHQMAHDALLWLQPAGVESARLLLSAFCMRAVTSISPR